MAMRHSDLFSPQAFLRKVFFILIKIRQSVDQTLYFIQAERNMIIGLEHKITSLGVRFFSFLHMYHSKFIVIPHL